MKHIKKHWLSILFAIISVVWIALSFSGMAFWCQNMTSRATRILGVILLFILAELYRCKGMLLLKFDRSISESPLSQCWAAILLFLVFIHRTPWGVRFQALSADSVLYETLGHDTRRTRTLVFLMSGAFIALGSCLSAYDIGLNQQMGMTALTNAMVAMVIGGVGRFGTCVLGGLSLGLLQALAVSQFTASWESGITFIVLILLLFLRPQGIAGRKMRTV